MLDFSVKFQNYEFSAQFLIGVTYIYSFYILKAI